MIIAELSLQRKLHTDGQKKQDDAFQYLTHMRSADWHHMHSFLTEQLSTKKGMERFGEAAAKPIVKHLEQLVY